MGHVNYPLKLEIKTSSTYKFCSSLFQDPERKVIEKYSSGQGHALKPVHRCALVFNSVAL